MMMVLLMMMMIFQGGNDMGRMSDLSIELRDEGIDPSDQEAVNEYIRKYVVAYMRTPEYEKEHTDQEKVRLTT